MMDPWYPGLFVALFIFTWLLRYLRLLVNIVAFAAIKPCHDSKSPKYTVEDVTIVMPTTFSDPSETIKCLKRMQSCGVAAIIVITSFDLLHDVVKCLEGAGLQGVEVRGVSLLNKRRQMLMGLEYVGTKITFFVDDDVYYPSTNLPQHLLNCFEDPNVGAAGPRLRAYRNETPSLWNFLGIAYLERRNFNTGATNALDGGISTLSGRTQAVRTAILRNREFYTYFRTDSFLGRKLAVDDDKALTRFLFSRGWAIRLNFHDECTLETKLEEGWGFIGQCVRWARGHWRGNLIVMAKERYWYATHPWTLYAVYAGQFQTPALLIDGVLFALLTCAVAELDDATKKLCYALFAAWLASTKLVKLVPHFARYPQDLKFVPASIAFSYLHGAINLYALLTTHKTVWGNRATASDQLVAREDSRLPAGLPLRAARPGELDEPEPNGDPEPAGKHYV